MEKILWQHIQTVKKTSPLVHNITNYVVMNNTANALLAAGASPIMSHAQEEVGDMVGICQALVINIGTLDPYWVRSMILAVNKANELSKPWVLDPVGAGATDYRNRTLSDLLALRPTVIRGNASEIMALAKANVSHTKGVDSTAESNEAIDAAISLNKEYGSVVCVSGAIDIVVDNDQTLYLRNGSPLMTKVTGLGCSATSIIGAFIGVVSNKSEAVAAAMSLLAISGELGSKQSSGPGTLQVELLDKLHNITETEFMNTIRISRN
ncbi:hydroxyethylthiazole kinase [Terrimonas sp. NA20]|uniref:Hydroxyethylthiazole kinase n=1 Tax=Terrimonas ginsenosidimutans TaxID=2908004 RepID=A0ABS9KTW9_9BACT|nr:hydroxyethylthiazole kinase [Terrimonas ginsenosidimutans]MCG2615737.1 hydroxyethylthiazole kinase [Terrimonas ginsenosidimutans]